MHAADSHIFFILYCNFICVLSVVIIKTDDDDDDDDDGKCRTGKDNKQREKLQKNDLLLGLPFPILYFRLPLNLQPE